MTSCLAEEACWWAQHTLQGCALFWVLQVHGVPAQGQHPGGGRARGAGDHRPTAAHERLRAAAAVGARRRAAAALPFAGMQGALLRALRRRRARPHAVQQPRRAGGFLFGEIWAWVSMAQKSWRWKPASGCSDVTATIVDGRKRNRDVCIRNYMWLHLECCSGPVLSLRRFLSTGHEAAGVGGPQEESCPALP